MKRILALALVAGALLLGGCGHPHAAQPAGAPAAPAAPAAVPATKDRSATANSATADSATNGSAGSSSDDVDSLLGDVDKQLNSDDQTPADQD